MVFRRFSTLLVSVAALTIAGASGCGRDAADVNGVARAEAGAGAAKPAPPKPAAPSVLAEATNPDVPVVVQVLEATRATADTVRIVLAFTVKAPSESPKPAAPAATSTLEREPEPVPLLGGADPADFCLLTPDGGRRLFLLRDAQNKPVLDGGLEPLKPGQRRVVQATFPAPPAQTGRVTIVLGKVVLRDVPIAPKAPAPDGR